MPAIDPESRARDESGDTTGGWIVIGIVLAAIGIGVWWWAGWKDASDTVVMKAAFPVAKDLGTCSVTAKNESTVSLACTSGEYVFNAK